MDTVWRKGKDGQGSGSRRSVAEFEFLERQRQILLAPAPLREAGPDRRSDTPHPGIRRPAQAAAPRRQRGTFVKRLAEPGSTQCPRVFPGGSGVTARFRIQRALRQLAQLAVDFLVQIGVLCKVRRFRRPSERLRVRRNRSILGDHVMNDALKSSDERGVADIDAGLFSHPAGLHHEGAHHFIRTLTQIGRLSQ